MTVGIYQIKNKANEKIYIGSSINIKDRWRWHNWALKSQKHHSRYLQRAWNKYGEENFIFEILEIVEDEHFLLSREQYYLDKYKPFKKEYGYNLSNTAGNCLGVKHSEETKRKMSAVKIGHKHSDQTKKKISASNMGKKGIPCSEEKKQYFRDLYSGRSVSDETKKRIGEKQKGELNHAAILTDDKVMKIKCLLMYTDLTIKEIGDYYRVIFQTISNIKRGKSWSHINGDALSKDDIEDL